MRGAVADFNSHAASERARLTSLIAELDVHEARTDAALRAVEQLEASELGVADDMGELTSALAALEEASGTLDARKVRAADRAERHRGELKIDGDTASLTPELEPVDDTTGSQRCART